MYLLAVSILVLAVSVLVGTFVAYVRHEIRRNAEKSESIFDSMPDWGTPPDRNS